MSAVHAVRLGLGVSARLLTAFLCGVLLFVAQSLFNIHFGLVVVAPAVIALFWTATVAATPHVKMSGRLQALSGFGGVLAAFYLATVASG
ncbi:MAG: hypothetical protein IH957_01840 [Chloroflexi bacterium]|nr:hypothetical protein [Chloroflexota bacterium]